MKKYFFILLFGGLFSNLHSEKITYLYDESGNRTARIIDFKKQAKKHQINDTVSIVEEQEQQTQYAEENNNRKYEDNFFQEKKVIIYPNPTQGQLVVEIQNYDTETLGDISIYTPNGLLLQKKEINSSNIPFDIGNQPDGMYLLNIKMDGKTSSWKILKQ